MTKKTDIVEHKAKSNNFLCAKWIEMAAAQVEGGAPTGDFKKKNWGAAIESNDGDVGGV